MENHSHSEKTAIYIITNPANEKKKMFKLGKHRGSPKKLISRYNTSIPDVKISIFNILMMPQK